MSPEVTFRLQLGSFDGGGPIAGAQVRLCSLTDPMCTSPLPQTFPPTDMNGVAVLTLPAPFAGYFDVQATNFVPELMVYTPTIAETMLPDTWVSFLMFPSDKLASYLAQVVANPDLKSLGELFVAPEDCYGGWAPDVSFTATLAQLGSSAIPYYVANGNTLEKQAKATASNPGGLVGGGWVQVQPGLVTVTATVGGAPVATQGMPIRAGAITAAVLVPTP
jgi:hypothetical protein